jgi:hypothetical protein
MIIVYQCAPRHIAADCVQKPFRLLFSPRKEWTEGHTYCQCAVLGRIGVDSMRTAIPLFDMNSVSNVRPYLTEPAHFNSKVAGFLSH